MSSDELGIGGLRSSERQRNRRFRGCLVVMVAMAILAGAGALVYLKGVALLSDSLEGPPDYTGNGSGSVVVQVRDGDTVTDIGHTLYRRKVVASTDAFINVARENPDSTSIQVGYYELKRRMSAKAALAMLLDPASRQKNTVTIPEGGTVDETVALLAEKTDIPLRDFAEALRRPQSLGLPAYAHGNAEGFLYATTYNVPPNATATEILRMMIDRWKAETEPLNLESGARKLGLTPYQVIIMASIAQAEVRHPADYPKVSRALLNRLKQGQAFQLDTTGEYGYTKHLADSPVVPDVVKRKIPLYNTYEHPGFPPGPISTPELSAIRGVLSPADGRWLYWVTTNLETGETHFSSTYAEHQKWVSKYRRYCETSKYC